MRLHGTRGILAAGRWGVNWLTNLMWKVRYSSALLHRGWPIICAEMRTLTHLSRRRGYHQIQTAKREKRDLHVVFLDLANAFGSVPHKLLWTALNFFNIPDTITTLVKPHFQDLQFCFSTPSFTTTWQRLEVGIMAGCTISPLAFTMAMELIIWASKWVVGGKRMGTGLRLPPL